MADGGSILSGAASGAATGSAFGPWGTVIGAGVGAVGSMVGAGKSSGAASKAQAQQEAMQRADLDFRRQQYDRYLGLFGPTEERLAAEARSTMPLDYEQNYAQIKQQYADALRGIQRGSAMGLPTGLQVGAGRQAAFGQANALSGAWGQGLINRRNLGLDLTGRGQTERAAGALSGGMQNMANLYGSQAALYNQAAQQGWQGFGQGLGNLAYSLQRMNQPVAPYSITGTPGVGSNFGNNWGNPVPLAPTSTMPLGPDPYLK